MNGRLARFLAAGLLVIAVGVWWLNAGPSGSDDGNGGGTASMTRMVFHFPPRNRAQNVIPSTMMNSAVIAHPT